MKIIYMLSVILVAVLMASGCTTQDTGAARGYTNVTPEEAMDLLQNSSDILIIDVSPVYANGHIPGAVNYYVGDGSLDSAIPTLDKNREYLVYCHSDSASMLGSQKLVDAGFKKVYRLKGNYAAWVDAGFPTEE